VVPLVAEDASHRTLVVGLDGDGDDALEDTDAGTDDEHEGPERPGA
jgi:hypothetical protein